MISAHRPGARIAGSGRMSYHASCRAVDFNPPRGKYQQVASWLKANHRGGVGTYSCGMHHIHIDSGPAVRFHKCGAAATHRARAVAMRRPSHAAAATRNALSRLLRIRHAAPRLAPAARPALSAHIAGVGSSPRSQLRGGFSRSRHIREARRRERDGRPAQDLRVKRMASRIPRLTASTVGPVATQPGRSGT